MGPMHVDSRYRCRARSIGQRVAIRRDVRSEQPCVGRAFVRALIHSLKKDFDSKRAISSPEEWNIRSLNISIMPTGACLVPAWHFTVALLILPKIIMPYRKGNRLILRVRRITDREGTLA